MPTVVFNDDAITTLAFNKCQYISFSKVAFKNNQVTFPVAELQTVDFKGAHFPKSVILYAVFFYVRYSVSYHDLQEILAERGVSVDHATLNRWVVRYSL